MLRGGIRRAGWTSAPGGLIIRMSPTIVNDGYSKATLAIFRFALHSNLPYVCDRRRDSGRTCPHSFSPTRSWSLPFFFLRHTAGSVARIIRYIRWSALLAPTKILTSSAQASSSTRFLCRLGSPVGEQIAELPPFTEAGMYK